MNNRRELINYLLFGGLTTAINIVAYFIMTTLYEGPYKIIVANIIAWIVAVLFAYYTNRKFVFQSDNRGTITMLREFGSFIGARILSLLLETVLLLILIDGIHVYPLISKVFSNIVVIIFNYYASKWFIFKKIEQKVIQKD